MQWETCTETYAVRRCLNRTGLWTIVLHVVRLALDIYACSLSKTLLIRTSVKPTENHLVTFVLNHCSN